MWGCDLSFVSIIAGPAQAILSCARRAIDPGADRRIKTRASNVPIHRANPFYRCAHKQSTAVSRSKDLCVVSIAMSSRRHVAH